MAREYQEQRLRCPFCAFGSLDFDKLDDHVQKVHANQQHGDDMGARPDTNQLSDFELAQLLAFEEAGLPSELALPDRPVVPAINGTRNVEGTTPSSPPSSSAHGNDDGQWVECVCGERVHCLELDAHADMHAQEKLSIGEDDLPSVELATQLSANHQPLRDVSDSFSTNIPRSLRNHDQLQPKTPPSNGRRRIPSLKEVFLGSPSSPKRKSAYSGVSAQQGKTRRLGRAELGPYAHEHQMPSWLRRMLEEGAKVTVTNRIGPDGALVRVETIANETPDLVPVLARLSQLDKTVERAFYCNPEVRHVCKMPREGGFCGYRNIQMLISYIRGARVSGSKHFRERLPSILRVQDLIEEAWDKGINSTGRVETGGIRLTRKYIGTPEAQALFTSLNIPCEATAYTSTGDVDAADIMLCAVCEYFDDDKTKDNVDKVVITEKPPIYFQHQGHSMTIVGVESRVDGGVNLVVFDPMFNPSPALKKLAMAPNTSPKGSTPEKLLKAHRRGEKYLEKYRDFELLKLK
ncbi:peptidase family C78-domain-containing protein [Exophiala viscosa]|uniref:Peptidase family C78-domain-containing protein n=1 Tax=Exophiala viscosa TaxID=2486360 RepID=A0AAN6IHM9_9EURO|nr:peptidase family C78-domain-containing protein [Exophiala viscosa]KAI1627076.1 peptidase family C78-domain-containing protein [Exophiala viscosa]